MEELATQAFWLGLAKIIGVNIVLSGDNAVVIALAARSLPPRQQKQAIFWGAGAAVVLRIILTIFAAKLLGLPWLKIVVGLCEKPSKPTFVYEDADPLWDKINKIAKKVYRAGSVTADAKVKAQIQKLQDDGYGHFPVCVAKTQSSFSTNAATRGAPSDHVVNVREVRLSAGAEFIVMICGDIMTMPGLPKVPSAEKIDLIDGKVVGLF